MNEVLELLHELNLHITTAHLDMGGNHRYSLNAKAHPVISKIKVFLSENPKDCPEHPYPGSVTYCVACGKDL